jgi:hypothetical protein
MTSFLLALSAAAQQSYSVNGGPPMAASPETLGSFIGNMGYIFYPITFCALMVAVLAVRAFMRMRSEGGQQPTLVRTTIDGTLFWGAYAAVLGVFGTVLGMVVAAQAVQAVNVIEPRLVFGGIKVALTSTMYGVFVFLVAALVWFGLRSRHRTAALATA